MRAHAPGTPGAARAAVQGLSAALRAPGLLLAIVLITIVAAVPFAIAVERPVMDSLAAQPPVPAISASEIDAEWWLEFRRHANGLAATFTPAILGFAAPLETVSALLDGTSRPWALAGPIAVFALLWSWLWGGVLHRFATNTTSARAFVAAASRHFVPMAAITLIAAAFSALLYLSVHALLFDVLYDRVASGLRSERDAFFARVALYLVFGAVLVLANAVFSFARVHVVAGGERRIVGAVVRGWTFVRARLSSTAGLYAIYLGMFAVVMIAYGATELLGGSRVGGWRAVVIGQAFIVFRLGLRLALAASQVKLAAGRQ